jgi:MFS family permease
MFCILNYYLVDIGVMSGAAIYIKKDLKITDVQLEILIGVLNLYSLIGSFAAGRTSDWMGRRFTVVFAAAIFSTGALVMGFAVNYGMLMAGRFVAGVGVGYAAMIAPVYTAEVSPASARGFLTSFPEVFINFGILLGVRVQLRVRAPPALPRLAGHARHRRGAVRPARVHGVRHARVVPVARHEGPPRGRQGRTGEDD